MAKALKQPRLILQAVVARQPYYRRFRLALWALVGVVVGLWALEEAAARGVVESSTLDIGRIAGVIAAGLLVIRVVLAFFRWRTRRDATLRIYDQGVIWQGDGQKRQYNWGKLQIFREGGRGIYLGSYPLAQWGAHTLTMTDNQVLRITPVYGDLRRIARAIRPYAASVTGTRMGRILRQDEEPLRLHPQLTVWPGGVEVGRKEIHWSALDVRLERDRLVIRERGEDGKFKPVRRFPIHTVDNMGGFVELATSTIRNYQRERFEKRA